jgi:phosphopantetheinyl transferase (holo-ACP synthase)
VIGNDLVDLLDPAIATHHLRPRFIERVCDERERHALRTAADPKRALWTLFAAKEAAYKLAVKLGLEPGFAHRRFVVTSDRVSFEDHSWPLRITESEDWVHAIVGEGEVLAGVEPGESARPALLDALAAKLGCETLEVVRDPLPGSWDGFGPPRVATNGVSIDVSLSHDGRFAAFAAAV